MLMVMDPSPSRTKKSISVSRYVSELSVLFFFFFFVTYALFTVQDEVDIHQPELVGRLFVKLMSAAIDVAKKASHATCNYHCELNIGSQKTISSSYCKPEWNEECELYAPCRFFSLFPSKVLTPLSLSSLSPPLILPLLLVLYGRAQMTSLLK